MDTLLSSPLLYVVVAWGVITVGLMLLLAYRRSVAAKEDDQLFLDGAEAHEAAEQQEIASRLERLTKPIITLSALSGLLVVVIAWMWIAERMKTF